MEILHSIWQFIQNQILGMKWLNEVIGIGLSNLGIDTTSRWGGSIQFFVYDVIKIMVLLGVLIFIISTSRATSRRNAPNASLADFMASVQTV